MFINKWVDFTKELQHENRFFPKKAINPDDIAELLGYLPLRKDLYPNFIYRARILREDTPYSIDKMGKPPLNKSIAGRANPTGISYFYGASDFNTAIAETRPYKSENVCVAKFRLSKSTRIIDMREREIFISPFGLDDDALSLLYREHMPFLRHLGGTLSIPVLPYKKDLEYLPTQYFCEFVKDKNYDGIVFTSSLGKGNNYVIFNDSLLTGIRVDTYSIVDTPINPVKVKI